MISTLSICVFYLQDKEHILNITKLMCSIDFRITKENRKCAADIIGMLDRNMADERETNEIITMVRTLRCDPNANFFKLKKQYSDKIFKQGDTFLPASELLLNTCIKVHRQKIVTLLQYVFYMDDGHDNPQTQIIQITISLHQHTSACNLPMRGSALFDPYTSVSKSNCGN
jgi:hypothetical protein